VASIVSGTNIASDQVGALAIVWADQAPGASGPAIYAQRFDASEESIDNAGVAISQSSNEGFPVIAASPALGGSYVVTWIDLGSGNQVRGRFLQGTTGDLTIPSGSGTGYLTNPNDGTPGEFPVTTETGRTRTSPTVAVGGGATGALGYVAFGWADKTADHSGIWARRFPLPTQ
jgi:hypothetical protein